MPKKYVSLGSEFSQSRRRQLQKLVKEGKYVTGEELWKIQRDIFEAIEAKAVYALKAAIMKEISYQTKRRCRLDQLLQAEFVKIENFVALKTIHSKLGQMIKENSKIWATRSEIREMLGLYDSYCRIYGKFVVDSNIVSLLNKAGVRAYSYARVTQIILDLRAGGTIYKERLQKFRTALHFLPNSWNDSLMRNRTYEVSSASMLIFQNLYFESLELCDNDEKKLYKEVLRIERKLGLTRLCYSSFWRRWCYGFDITKISNTIFKKHFEYLVKESKNASKKA